MSQRYPRAVDLAQMPHCSVCGETNPLTDDGGDTTCCARRECPGMGPEAQDVCCQALQDRVDHEAVYGTPASPLSLPPRQAPTPARSTQTNETRSLRSLNAVCNTGVTPGGAEPPTTPKEPDMALSTAAATSAVCRNLYKDGPESFEPVGYRFGKDRDLFESWAKAWLRDKSNLADSTIEGADWNEVFAAFQPEAAGVQPAAPEAAAPAAPEAEKGWSKHHSADVYYGYAVMAADRGRVWHLGRHNDEVVCRAKVDRYIGLERAAELKGGICAACSRYLSRHGAYIAYVAPAPAAPAAAPQEPAEAPAPAAPAARPAAARKGARAALGPSSADGWDLLYDKPKAGAEVGRRYVDGKPQFALVCKTHRHVHPLARLSDEGAVRKAGGWCPSC